MNDTAPARTTNAQENLGTNVELTGNSGPSKPRAWQTAKAAGGVLVVVLAQWGLAFASVLSYLLPLILVGGIAWAARRRHWLSVVVILTTSPLTFSFSRGLAAYGRDDAYMMSVGLQDSGSTFIDSHTRLPVATRGCLVEGNEWVWDSPYNAALHLLTAVAGPPSGTYGGPIPTEDEARAALDGAALLPWRELARDEVGVDGRRVVLQRWLGPALVDAVYSFDPLADEPDSPLAPDGMIHARVWRDRVLLIELRDAFFDDVPSHVAVVDVASGRLFGHFPGPRSSRGFPLAWRPVGPRILDMDYVEGPPR